jgi:FkbM family methyltransferase
MSQLNGLPDYESILERFYRSFLTPGNTCVDVGAHEGRHLFPMLECIGREGRVLAFEPIPSLAEKLQAKVRQAGWADHVHVHAMALSDSEGTTSFMVAEDAPGYSGILKREYDVPTRVTEITVELSTLDIMARNLEALDYVKIDAEGAEWSILRGARETLQRYRPVVSFEFGEASYGAYGVVPEDVHTFFTQMGYVVHDILGQGLDCEAFALSSRHQAVWDYVALPSNRHVDELLLPLTSRA